MNTKVLIVADQLCGYSAADLRLCFFICNYSLMSYSAGAEIFKLSTCKSGEFKKSLKSSFQDACIMIKNSYA